MKRNEDDDDDDRDRLDPVSVSYTNAFFPAFGEGRVWHVLYPNLSAGEKWNGYKDTFPYEEERGKHLGWMDGMAAHFGLFADHAARFPLCLHPLSIPNMQHELHFDDRHNQKTPTKIEGRR